MTIKNSDKKPKVIKIEKTESKKIELTPEQLTLKEQFMDIDAKMKQLEEVVMSVYEENNETLFCDEFVSNIVGLAALSCATKIIGQYFDIENLDLNNLL